VRLASSGWGTTALQLPPGTWTDRITGGGHRGSVAAAELFADLPVVLLERGDG
jgi:(1->4)-alpha-D-glucan 1-alpha-D-glucosylmutase